MAGYSGTPLTKKLGIKEGSSVFLLGAPKYYLELVAPFPEGARVVRRIDGKTDIVHIFSTERAQIDGRASRFAREAQTGWDDLGVLAEKIL
jgi:hypothetical protein